MFIPMRRITVTPEKLVTSLIVWLRIAPKRIWRKSEEYERRRAEKRHSSAEAPDPHGELADYLAERFQQSGWEVTHPEARNHG
jgi:hypothetical protein